MNNKVKTEVCIMGAGPSGCAAALKLSYLDIPCVLIDKSRFPRDKVCGDAISGKSPLMMSRLDESMVDRFIHETEHTDIWGIRFGAPNGKEVEIPFKLHFNPEEEVAPGFVCKRWVFDHFLIKEVRLRNNIKLISSVEIDHWERSSNGFLISSTKSKKHWECKVLIDASGAQSRFSRKYAGLEKDVRHTAGAVRAYFKNVKFPKDRYFIELHFIKEYLPGYFWIFPLPNNEANVGIGMRTDKIKAKNIHLKKAMLDIMDRHPLFKERFADAELIGKIEGFGLPLGSKKRKLSGDHFMLVGDAAHLIDPATGEGIGNGFYSGIYAAEQAKTCLDTGDFSENRMKDYDIRIQRVLGTEMKFSYQIQRMLNSSGLTNFFANTIVNNPRIISGLTKMYTDVDYRKQLLNPLFWLKMRWKK